MIIDAGSAKKAYGSYALSASSNSASGTVYLYGGTIATLYGSHASTTLGYTNNVTAGGIQTIPPESDTITASATGNIYMYGGTVTENLYGANATPSANKADASVFGTSNGIVEIHNDSVIGGNIYGSYAGGINWGETDDIGNIFTAQSIGSVSIYGGSIGGDIYGAYAAATVYNIPAPGMSHFSLISSATGKVYFGGGSITGSIYGAFVTATDKAEAHSTVTITNTAQLQNTAAVWGRYLEETAKAYDVFSGKTLNMSANPLTIASLGNFEKYNFAINDYNNSVINAAGSALLTVTKSLENRNTVILNDDGTTSTTANQSKVKLTGISGTATVHARDTINLLQWQDSTVLMQGSKITDAASFFNLTGSSNIIDVGLARTAKVTYSIVGNAVVATIEKPLTKITAVAVAVAVATVSHRFHPSGYNSMSNRLPKAVWLLWRMLTGDWMFCCCNNLKQRLNLSAL